MGGYWVNLKKKKYKFSKFNLTFDGYMVKKKKKKKLCFLTLYLMGGWKGWFYTPCFFTCKNIKTKVRIQIKLLTNKRVLYTVKFGLDPDQWLEGLQRTSDTKSMKTKIEGF